MSFAIGHIIYGASLNNAPASCHEDVEYISECDLAHSAYSGNGDTPLWIGSQKGTIDECVDVEFSELMQYQVTDEDIKIFEEDKRKLLLDMNEESEALEGEDVFEFSQEFKEWVAKVEPTMFITWGSS